MIKNIYIGLHAKFCLFFSDFKLNSNFLSDFRKVISEFHCDVDNSLRHYVSGIGYLLPTFREHRIDLIFRGRESESFRFLTLEDEKVRLSRNVRRILLLLTE